YEIIRDVGLRPKETQQSITVSAIKFSQPGGEGYLLALKPYELLKMSYVHRRSKGDTLAYQRIIKQQKVESMAAFLKSGKSTLPNDVILSIDEDAKDLVHYDTKTMKLTLPGGYCTAWVVDGQHRLYGFNETKFGKDAALEDFEIPVVAFVALGLEKQTAMFVDINNNQKRIDSTLLADLSTVLKDLSRKETWPSLLAKGLSERGPFEGMVRIFELKSKKNVKPITLAGLSRYALARNLLAPKISKGKIVGYSGPLYRYSKFDWELSFNNSKNQESFNDQLNVLNEFFTAVKVHLKRKWTDTERYGATTYSGVNALLLVLNRILEQRKSFTEQSMYKLLEPLKNSRINWRRSNTRKFTNYAGFIELANKIMKALNKVNKDQLNYYLPKVKSPA
ncbi:MAG: DGQHR domain-containing protein, partial [Nitrososphaerota archaeon]|nr:DGQHR domain-containing protein [Nitrososphaerota archaeon]